MKFSCICDHIITHYIYVFCRENRGWGGGDGLSFSSSSSSYMDCEVKFVYECYRVACIGFGRFLDLSIVLP